MSTYRILSNGQMTSSFQCPLCPQRLTVLYNANSLLTACCAASNPPYSIFVWIVTGENFSTAAQFYTDDTLSQTVSNGWYTTTGPVGTGRTYRVKTSSSLGNATSCSACP